MAKTMYRVRYNSIATGKRQYVQAASGEIKEYPKEKAERIAKILRKRGARVSRA